MDTIQEKNIYDSLVKVSVIVPVFNGEKHIEECINSISNQTFKEIEILIMNDGSTDSTKDICNKLELTDSRIKTFCNENMGQGLERNRGLQLSKGKYVMFIDADDTLAPNMIETLYMTANIHDADIVSCGYNEVYSNHIIHHAKQKKIFLQNDIPSLMLDLISSKHKNRDYEYCIGIWDSIYKKETIDSNNIRFKSERNVYSEDLLFKLEFLSNSNCCVFLDSCYYNYRAGEVSFSRNINEVIIDRIINLQKIISNKYCNTFHNEIEERARKRTFFTIRYNFKLAKKFNNKNDFYSYLVNKNELFEILKFYKPTNIKDRIFKIVLFTRNKLIYKYFSKII